MSNEFTELYNEMVEFINSLDPHEAYQVQIDNAIANEDYELAEKIKQNRIKELGS